MSTPSPSPSPSPSSTRSTGAGTPGARRRWVALALVAGLAVTVGGAALATAGGGGGGGGEPAAVTLRVDHVHGIGVDPADGSLVLGTHEGLYRAGAAGVEGPVGDRVQDFMGFTVAGPGRYLASGHPGSTPGPADLGLIESTDGGLTWTTRSLGGEVDFHALEHRHGLTYGVDAVSGRLLVSEDLETWETRSVAPLADLAVSPDDPDVLLGTSADGPVRSSDGGRSFTLVEGAPLLLLLSWADDGTLVGASPAGDVHVSSDGGATWHEAGALGRAPQALLAVDGTTVHAVAGDRVLTSDDGGATFGAYDGG